MFVMSSDIDNQPYDNVEFPIRRPTPGTGGYPGMSPVQRGHLITGGSGKVDKGYGLATVAEGVVTEEGEEMVTVEDQRQKVGVANKSDTHLNQNTPVPTSTVITSPPPRAQKVNHVSVPPQKPPHSLHTNTGSDRSTIKTIKPSPSPSRDSKASFVFEQPKPEDFTWSAFHPTSQEVFENAYTRHKYFYKFSDKVLKQGTRMKTNVWDVPGRPGETMTYEQMLQGVLIEGEKIVLGGGWLQFKDIEFFDPEGTKQTKPPLGEGRICLTNMRMIIVCAEMSSDARISEYGDPAERRKGGYKLSVSKLNNVYFQNIPIDCFESVELSSTVGIMAESKLVERQPTCCGLFSFIGVGRCGYTWDATPPLPVNVVKRFIRLGAYLPPWRTPTTLIVNLHPKLSLTTARDFVVQLQNHVPQMKYHVGHGHGATVL